MTQLKYAERSHGMRLREIVTRCSKLKTEHKSTTTYEEQRSPAQSRVLQLDVIVKQSLTRHATQRNATQRNATQRNATQRNATTYWWLMWSENLFIVMKWYQSAVTSSLVKHELCI